MKTSYEQRHSMDPGFERRIFAYRHKVFIEKLGWDLVIPNTENLEQDQFDRPDTIYVTAYDEADEICGCARLLPTTSPYLLGDVFPQLLNGQPIPRSGDVWELSRFAAVNFSSDGKAEKREQWSSIESIDLLRAAIECAAENGAKRLITVSPIGVERLLRRAGFQAHRAGPPVMIDGDPIFACWIEIGA